MRRPAVAVLAMLAGCGGPGASPGPKPAESTEWEVRPDRRPKPEEPPPPPKAEATGLPSVLLIGEGGGPGDELGRALALRGELLLVGAPGHEVGKAAAGAVHVFELQGGRWVELDRLVSSTPVAGGRFGHALALTPGGWLFVGAPGEEDGWGKVYIFRRGPATRGKPGQWTLAGALRGVVDSGAAGEVRVSGFGQVLAASDDLLAVGAPDTAHLGGKHSVRGDIAGALVSFRRQDKAWVLAGHAVGQLPGFAAALTIAGDKIVVDDGGAVAVYGAAAGKPGSRLAETGGPRLAAGGTGVAMLAGGLGSQKSAHFTVLQPAGAGLTRGAAVITAVTESASAQLAFDGERALAAGPTSLGAAGVLLVRDAAGAWSACAPFTARQEAASALPIEDVALRALGRAVAIDGATFAVGAELDDGRGGVYLFAAGEVATTCRH